MRKQFTGIIEKGGCAVPLTNIQPAENRATCLGPVYRLCNCAHAVVFLATAEAVKRLPEIIQAVIEMLGNSAISGGCSAHLMHGIKASGISYFTAVAYSPTRKPEA